MSAEKGGALRTENAVMRRVAFALVGGAAMVGVPLVLLASPATAGRGVQTVVAASRPSRPSRVARGAPTATLVRFLRPLAVVRMQSARATTSAVAATTTTTATAAAPVSAPITETAPSTETTPAPVSAPATASTDAAPAPASPPAPAVTPAESATGIATWYGTSPLPTGCASPTLPFGTVVNITDDATGGTATCVVDDREPYHPGRVLDLSYTVFSELASPTAGVVTVTITW
jgi:rare lipoprotein A